jgi:hypothetical protein
MYSESNHPLVFQATVYIIAPYGSLILKDKEWREDE